MNILPKKRWHVRTKDNIARVRRDEALAAEEEKKKQLRTQIAEREARAELLRKKARDLYGTHRPEPPPQPEDRTDEVIFADDKHVNLFYELERNEVVSTKTNEEYEREKKEEREKYEKQIGYLTYLGQDTNEMTGTVSWYNKSREEFRGESREEASKKQKVFEDPLGDIRKYLSCDGVRKVRDESVKKTEAADVETSKRTSSSSSSRRRRRRRSSSSETDDGVKRKKHKKKSHRHKKKSKRKRRSSSESDEPEVVSSKPKVDVEKLRAERLRREQEERRRADQVFARLNGVTVKKEESPPAEPAQKYNSQFNPHLAKQNYL